MKKLITVLAVAMLALVTAAEYRNYIWTSGSNTVANTITGQTGRVMTLISVAQDVEGTETNVATVAFTPSGGTAYRCDNLSTNVGGEESAQILNAGDEETFPVILKGGDIWTVTSTTTGTSNTTYVVTVKVERD